jgi:hypothetical protein
MFFKILLDFVFIPNQITNLELSLRLHKLADVSTGKG